MESYLLLAALFLGALPIQAQTLYNGVGHIPAAYQERWNRAGLLRDMSTVEPKLVINVASLSGNDDQKVQTALNQARSHVQSIGGLAIIYFPPGTYTLTTTIPTVPSDSNIVFQGAGSDRTFLVFQNMKNLPCFNLSGSAPDFSSQSDLDQNFNKGDSIIHAANGYGLSSINPGDWIHFVKFNFDYEDPNAAIEEDIVGQITRLEAKGTDANGEWGEIKDVANMNYIDSSDPNYSLKVREVIPVQNIGIENLTIKRNPDEQATAYVSNINFDFAVNCWVKGVELYKASRNHFSISHSSHIEVSGCYFHEAMYYGDGGWGYGVVTCASSTNCLIENNIFRKLRHAMVAGGGSNCNVWTFNYSREQYSTWNGIPYSDRDLDLHAKYPFGHLFEHNIVEQIESDDYHGNNGPYNTFVRNMATKRITYFKTMQQWSTLGNMRFMEGLLYPLQHNWDYGPAQNIYGFLNNYTTPVSHNRAYDYGAYSSYRLDDVSYYYSSEPDFLDGIYTWPAIGPETTTSGGLSYSIPAEDRFNSSKKTYLADPTPKPLTTSGTLPYDQTWPNGHTLTGNVTVPDNVILFIADGATINLNGYYVKCQGSGQIIKQGSATFSPSDISIKSGSVIKGQYSTFQQAWDNVASGQSVYLDSGTYTGDIDMKPNVGLYGKGEDYTTINGRVNFSGDDYASLEAVQVNQKIAVTSSDYVYIAIKAGSADCYLDIYGSWADASMTSTVSRNQGIYAHQYSDLGFWGLEMRNKSWGVDLYLSTDAVIEGVYFCQNNYDINADPGCSADAWSCNFSSSEEGGSVLGNVSWDVWDWCGMQKRAVTNANAASSGNKNVALHSADSSPTEYREAMNIYQTIKRNLRQDRLAGELANPQKYVSEFASAIEKFKQVVANYPFIYDRWQSKP
ncbi:MAG: glycosyl hydrolase family 28-related protein [candidate division KSB1 bacterium]|nr:glycosyl hydrolase family 28-related protein [candidate division KSB1 bacterium]